MTRRAPVPKRVRVRMYQVGFGDCFLLTFAYAPPGRPRHVLIDFGSTEAPAGSSQASLLARIATNIRDTVGKDPFAVVATHRHADHISGFDPGSRGDGPGAVIAALKPRWVIQPWTEQLDLPVDAQAPPGFKGMARRVSTLTTMQRIAGRVVDKDVPRLSRSLGATRTMKELAFIGQDNLGNRRAVENLATMGKNDYVYAGKRTRLEGFLPGVKVHVLGPPTVKQSAGIRKQRSADPDQFWLSQAHALGVGSGAGSEPAGPPPLFENFEQISGGSAPQAERWLVRAMRRSRGDQLLGIVRSLDKAMNNTSVILVFEFGGQRLLFPGDAQIENWEYALGRADLAKLLRGIDIYKVGHHGSRNATPKELWRRWFPDDAAAGSTSNRSRSMTSMLSTKPGKHGDQDAGTEVPRETLVKALKKFTDLVATDEMGVAPYVDKVIGP